jgi:hypothetical protein
MKTRHIKLPPAILDALNEAIRIAARTDGAPGRCARKTCRRSGRCHSELDNHGCPDCAGHLSARAEDSAVDMLVFLCKLRLDAERMAPEPLWRQRKGTP